MISIVIPAYNSEKRIEITLKDFLQQSFQDFELIIVNDGSTDDTEKICSNFIRKHSLSWKLISRKNEGVSVARNTGLDLALGKYLLFCDGDDRFEKNYLARMHYEAERSDCEVVFCGIDIFDTISNSVRNIRQSKIKFFKEKTGPDVLNRFLVKDRLNIQLSRSMFRADLIRKWNIRFEPEYTVGQDQPFTAKALFHAGIVSCIDDVLVHYVQWEGQSTKRSRNIRERARIEWMIFLDMLNYFEEHQASEKILESLDKYYLPNTAIKDLSLAIRSGETALFWNNLRSGKYYQWVEKSQSLTTFKRKPDTWFKGFLLCHAPALFVALYSKRVIT